MIAKVFGGLLYVCLLVTASVDTCATNPRDEGIVGVWQSMGIDTPIRTVFRRDHTVVQLFPEENGESGWLQFQVGTWRLEGNKIIAETRGMRIGADEVLSDGGRTEMSLREIHPDRLVRAEDRPDLLRANVARERYRQIVFLLCAVLSVGVFFPVLQFGRKFVAKGMTLLCIAVAGACLWASLNLIDELSQTGNMIVSPVSLIALRTPAAASGLAAAGSLLLALLMFWRSRSHFSQK